MSDEVLARTRAYLEGNGLISGYTVRYHRWLDADLTENTPVCVLRKTGDGQSDPFKQEIDVTITLMESGPTKTQTLGENIRAIVASFRTEIVTDGVIKFELLGSEQGPFFTENERPLYQVNVRVFTEDQ